MNESTKRTAAFICIMMTMLLSASFTADAEVTSSEQKGNWTAFSDQRACWVVGSPLSIAESRNGKTVFPTARDVLIFVTYHTVKQSPEISFHTTQNLKAGSTVTVEVDSKEFQLHPSGTWAFPHSADLDKALLSSIIAGKTTTVTARFRNGNTAIYQFSLNGFSSAITRAAQLCGVKTPKPPSAKPRSQGDSGTKE